ncbi:retrotransposable element ORF2 protein [Plecturocebus cupreus]
MEYYVAIKNDEFLSFVGPWMNLETIILSKLTQEQKIKHCMFSLTESLFLMWVHYIRKDTEGGAFPRGPKHHQGPRQERGLQNRKSSELEASCGHQETLSSLIANIHVDMKWSMGGPRDIDLLTKYQHPKWSLALSPRLECNGASWLTATSASWVEGILLPQPLKSVGLQIYCRACHGTGEYLDFLGTTQGQQVKGTWPSSRLECNGAIIAHSSLELLGSCAQRESCSVAQAGVLWPDLGSLQPPAPGFNNSSASASRVAEITGTCQHAQLIFCIFSRDTVSPC